MLMFVPTSHLPTICHLQLLLLLLLPPVLVPLLLPLAVCYSSFAPVLSLMLACLFDLVC